MTRDSAYVSLSDAFFYNLFRHSTNQISIDAIDAIVLVIILAIVLAIMQITPRIIILAIVLFY